MPTAIAPIDFGTFSPFGALRDPLVERERSDAGARPPRVG